MKNVKNILPFKWACTFFFVINGLVYGSVVSRIPAIKEQSGLDEAQLGQALLGLGLGALLAFPLTGLILKSVGSAKMALGACAALLAILPVIGSANTFTMLIISLCALGFALGAMEVAMSVQAIALEKEAKKPCMSWLFAMASVGGLAGAIGSAVMVGFSTAIHFCFIAVLAMSVLPFVQTHLAEDRENHNNADVEVTTGFQLPPFALLGVGLLTLCAMVSEGAVADWSALLLRSEKGASESLAALGYGSFSAAMIIGRLLGDRIRLLISDMKLVRVLSVIALLGMSVTLLTDNPVLSLLGLGLVGLGLSVITPILFSAAGNHQGVDPAIAIASISTLGYGGMLLGPPFIGMFAQDVGLNKAMMLVALLCGILVFFTGFIRNSNTESSIANPE